MCFKELWDRSLVMHPRRTPRIIEVNWRLTPIFGRLKIITDGPMGHGVSGKADYDKVFRDFRGSFLEVYFSSFTMYTLFLSNWMFNGIIVYTVCLLCNFGPYIFSERPIDRVTDALANVGFFSLGWMQFLLLFWTIVGGTNLVFQIFGATDRFLSLYCLSGCITWRVCPSSFCAGSGFLPLQCYIFFYLF